jgi:class 3 adenylate cyclase
MDVGQGLHYRRGLRCLRGRSRLHCTCGTENPAGAKFCAECGEPLWRSCPACRVQVAAGAKFCAECGTRVDAPAPDLGSYTPRHLAEQILSSRAAIEGERKQVTVLFCDVKESMSLAAALDAEEWRRIMRGFLDVVCEGVHRFEGTVNQFTGDGMMALFGAPIAHEDHARRACHAALHLSRAVADYADGLARGKGLTFDVRFGVNSGDVVVGAIGDDLHMDYTAIGHTVGLAQRMEALAAPGHVYLTEHTARLVDGWFALRDLGPKEVKGGGAPLGVYVLEGPRAARSSFLVASARGLSRFVGREHEMAALESALARAQDGNAQVVGVVGEAGVGKSRLCAEFAQACTAQGITVKRGHGLSYGKHMPLQPILEFFRDYFEIIETDTPQRTREKIAGRLVSLGASDDELLVFFDFMEVADPQRPLPQMPAEERMRRIFDMVRRATPRRSERATLVLVFEDLHWFDAASEAFLEELIESYPGTRTLIVTNFRPEFHARWMRHSYYRQIALSALGSAEARAMVGGLVGEEASLVPLVESLTERTSGNPFFLEEVVRSLIEDGTLEPTAGGYKLARSLDRLGVPATVQAVVGARIDRLPEGDKEILQTASVIGRTFSEPILCRIAQRPESQVVASLRGLCSAEFLSEEAVHPAPEYRFWHPLTQEVAYGSLLAERRRRIHAAVAAALLESDPEGSGEQAAFVAHHWQEAGEAALAARWHWRAAEWATYRDSLDALRRWRLMLELLEECEATTETLELGVMARARLMRFGARMGLSNADRRELYEQG